MTTGNQNESRVSVVNHQISIRSFFYCKYVIGGQFLELYPLFDWLLQKDPLSYIIISGLLDNRLNTFIDSCD